MLEDAAPMAAAEQLGQAVMEFDPSATVETVIELDENGQPIIQSTGEALLNQEIISEDVVIEIDEVVVVEAADDEINEEISEAVEEVTPESEDKSAEQK
jgi:segregation and condensation protein B